MNTFAVLWAAVQEAQSSIGTKNNNFFQLVNNFVKWWN